MVVVPYNVTFDHSQAAKQVYERFQSCLGTILTSGLPEANLSPAQLEDLPLYSVGHRLVGCLMFSINLTGINVKKVIYLLSFAMCSNGALLQLLTGSLFTEKIPKVWLLFFLLLLLKIISINAQNDFDF